MAVNACRPNSKHDLFAAVESMRAKTVVREAEQANVRRQRAEENRRLMPCITAWIDEIRAFFPGATVAYAKEGGVVMGAPMVGGVKLSETSISGSFSVKANK